MISFPQNLRDKLKAQCEANKLTDESARQRLAEIRATPKDELVNRLAKRLLENSIIEKQSDNTVFEN